MVASGYEAAMRKFLFVLLCLTIAPSAQAATLDVTTFGLSLSGRIVDSTTTGGVSQPRSGTGIAPLFDNTLGALQNVEVFGTLTVRGDLFLVGGSDGGNASAGASGTFNFGASRVFASRNRNLRCSVGSRGFCTVTDDITRIDTFSQIFTAPAWMAFRGTDPLLSLNGGASGDIITGSDLTVRWSTNVLITFRFTYDPAPIPLPDSTWGLIAALGGLAALRRAQIS